MTLPAGWANASIALGSERVTKGTTPTTLGFSYTEGGIRFVKAESLRNRRIDHGLCAAIGEDAHEALSRSRLQADDVLITIAGTLGRVARVVPEDVPANTNQAVAIIRSNGLFDAEFLTRFLAYAAEKELVSPGARGTGLQNLNLAQVSALSSPVPPMAEQRRIVAKLNALTTRLDRARAELNRVPVLAASLRLAALREIFHWTDEGLPTGWERKRIDEVGSVQLGRQRSPKDHSGPHMRPYVRAANITWSGWDLSDVKEMNFSPAEFETFALRPGEVLLNEGSGSAKEVGKPAVWRGEIESACFQNTLLRVRPKGYLPELLRYALLYVALSGKFISNTQGVNIIHIGKAGLARTTVPVPPVSEQDALLEALDGAFARADRFEVEAARARALLDRLEAAILARAFRGELVPQDRADEPATTLLARIRAQREAAPKVKRGRRARETADV